MEQTSNPGRFLPILFNTEMVRAILAGRKTVTRRLVKFKPGQNPQWTGYIPDGPVLYGSNNIPAAKAPYSPGDALYVRETWANWHGRYAYRANDCPTRYLEQDGTESALKWHPSIHMPKEAARLFLRVLDVRVERLQDMSIADIEKEGFRRFCFMCRQSKDGRCAGLKTKANGCWLDASNSNKEGSFRLTWDSTLKPAGRAIYGWDANPWVWVIEFERCEKPEEANSK